jgi:hypothetical protein
MAKLTIASNDKMLQHNLTNSTTIQTNFAIRSNLASQRASSVSDGVLQKYFCLLPISVDRLGVHKFTSTITASKKAKKINVYIQLMTKFA